MSTNKDYYTNKDNKVMKSKAEQPFFIQMNMRSIIAILTVVFLIPLITSCESIVDKSPRGNLNDDAVWADERLVDAFITDVYANAQIGNNVFPGNDRFIAFWQTAANVAGAEHTLFAAWQGPLSQYALLNINGVDNPVPDFFAQWRWINMRRANTIIERLETSDLSPSFVQMRRAEVRFLRSFMYFRMVKRYGGVPLITRAQSLDDPIEEIMRVRNSEQEIYDFIISEMDDILNDLPSHSEAGRANRGAALLLKSRAALYAASIARFGEMQMDGLLGIPQDQEMNYWQFAYDASTQLINNEPFQLFNQIADPVENFRRIFDVESMNSQPEAIFGEVFNGIEKFHAYSQQSLPQGPAIVWNSNFNVLYEMVELFDFRDGSSGQIPRSQVTGQEWSLQEFILDRDPRFLASVFYPEMELFDETIYFHSGTIVNGNLVTNGTIDGVWPAVGPPRNRNRSGLHVRKRSNERFVTSGDNPDNNDIVVMRLGEAYLNAAEAAYYLGLTGEALQHINAIRSRAGMPNRGSINEDIIRQERQVELAFENHRYWDLRRWRIAHQVLDGYRATGIEWIKNWDTGNYQISFKNVEGNDRIFMDRHYYLPIGINRVTENPNMVENPGYGY